MPPTHGKSFLFAETRNSSEEGVALGPDAICSLGELMGNATLAMDVRSCRVVYTFVLGGGASEGGARKAQLLRTKATDMRHGHDTNVTSKVKTRCLYEDPECGGTDVTQWTLDAPQSAVTPALRHELRAHRDDMTFLRVPENHELGKTDTWMTYAALLARSRPDLQMGFVGKLDSDNVVKWPRYFDWLERTYRREVEDVPFLYGGYAIHRSQCSQRHYGFVCARRGFRAEAFATGAFAYVSTPLARHVYLDGTTLAHKRGVWVLGEDLQLANMAYSDPQVVPFVLNHRYGQGRKLISTHCYNDPACVREKYSLAYPDADAARQ